MLAFGPVCFLLGPWGDPGGQNLTHRVWGAGKNHPPPPPLLNLAFSECPMAESSVSPPRRKSRSAVTQETSVCMALLWGSRMLRPGLSGTGSRGLSLVASDGASICQLPARGGGDGRHVTWPPCTSSSLSLLLWGDCDCGGPSGICPTLTGLETGTPAAQLLAAGCGLGLKCAFSSVPAASRPP